MLLLLKTVMWHVWRERPKENAERKHLHNTSPQHNELLSQKLWQWLFFVFCFFKLGIIPSMHLHRAQLEGKVRSTDGHLDKVQFLHFQQSLTHINGYFIQNNIYWKNEDKLGSEAKFCSPQCNKYKLLMLV